ncbi:MAG: hypothetical protein RSA44_01155, partial [Bacteroides sp.]
SCKVGRYTEEKGLPNQAYLLFVSNHSYSNTVQVTIDNKISFDAKVLKEKKMTVKGNTYAIGTGRKKLKVVDKGKTIYEKEIFVTTQETKKIQLP